MAPDVALLIDPVRVLPETDDVEGALLSPSSVALELVAGEGMYEMLERLPRRGVSVVVVPVLEEVEATGCEPRLSGLGKACREGVLEVGVDVEAHSDWSICGVFRDDGPAASCCDVEDEPAMVAMPPAEANDWS